jgi:hypothetical protein
LHQSAEVFGDRGKNRHGVFELERSSVWTEQKGDAWIGSAACGYSALQTPCQLYLKSGLT